VIPPAGPFNHGIEMRANCCVDEAFRDVDRAPTVMYSVFAVMRDWLCSVQTSQASRCDTRYSKWGPSTSGELQSFGR
jgi:hypothetical protein